MVDASGLTATSLSRAATILAVLEVCAIVVLAGLTVARSQIFGLDEGAHLAYVAEMADHGKLPWLGRDPPPGRCRP